MKKLLALTAALAIAAYAETYDCDFLGPDKKSINTRLEAIGEEFGRDSLESIYSQLASLNTILANKTCEITGMTIEQDYAHFLLDCQIKLPKFMGLCKQIDR